MTRGERIAATPLLNKPARGGAAARCRDFINFCTRLPPLSLSLSCSPTHGCLSLVLRLAFGVAKVRADTRGPGKQPNKEIVIIVFVPAVYFFGWGVIYRARASEGERSEAVAAAAATHPLRLYV